MDITKQLTSAWKNHLQHELKQSYFQNLITFLETELETQTIYPSTPLIFNAFNQCAFANIKVVIIGQDPYHGDGQANGLCFSVNNGVKIPPSLKNVFKEIQNDLGKSIPSSGNLEPWAKQGVLLLNSILTVQANQAASHRKKGWEQFTDAVIKLISEQKEQVVFLLWGNYAQKKAKIVDSEKHLILKSVHPSPLSAKKFFNNQHFSKTNVYLQTWGKQAINW
ncbi:MAG: uracil-DNA glycosylase [Thiomargarita sp.]|nr:uracil-DNA glycosylase [Thiomargarita sp.]